MIALPITARHAPRIIEIVMRAREGDTDVVDELYEMATNPEKACAALTVLLALTLATPPSFIQLVAADLAGGLNDRTE